MVNLVVVIMCCWHIGLLSYYPVVFLLGISGLYVISVITHLVATPRIYTQVAIQIIYGMLWNVDSGILIDGGKNTALDCRLSTKRGDSSMAKHYAVKNIRIPAELDDRMVAVVGEGGRYKSIAQFIEMAVRRLVTFEEGEMERKQVGVSKGSEDSAS